MLACGISFSRDTSVCCEMYFACVCAAVGDTVVEDEVVCEIETDKVVSAVLLNLNEW